MRKKIKSLRTALISFVLLVSTPSSAATLKPPIIEKLSNGLEIAWFEDARFPLIDLGLYIDSGSVDDPKGKSGTAELMSSSLFRGAAGLSMEALARSSERLGASRYSSASDESMAIGFHGLAKNAPELLSLLAKVALQPDFPETEVQEQKARLADRWGHIGDYADTLAGLAFSRRLTAETPYGRGSFTSMAEFQKITRNDVSAFHQKYFRPENAILLISGRTDREKLRKLIDEALGEKAWPGVANETKVKRPNYSEPRLAKLRERILIIHRPQLTQASIRIGFRGPLVTSPDHYPTMVLNALLGEHFHSRLNSLLRDKLGLTYSVGSSFSFERELGVFSIASSTRNQTGAQLITKTLQVLQELKSGAISEAEVETAKEYLVGSFSISSASPASAVSRWLMGRIHGLGPEYLNEYIPRIRAVTHAEVIEAARKHLDPDHAVITAAGDASLLEPDLRALKIAPLRRIGLKDIL